MALTLLSIASVLLIISSQTLAQTAPPPESSGVINVTGILDKAGQYKTLIRLMGKNQIATQVENQLNNSDVGVTLLAPTDNAFDNLPAGTLNKLTDQEQVELIQYHILPKYYALTDFSTVSNPVRTQYQDGLNFTTQGSQVNVSSGIVTTQINNALRQLFPFAVYQLDKVMLPPSLFGAKPPASPPPPPTPASSKTNKTTTESDAPSSPSDKANNSGRVNVGMGLVVGFVVVLCMGAFS